MPMSHRTSGPRHRRSQRDRMLADELYIADEALGAGSAY
jgi:hypothetical protein